MRHSVSRDLHHYWDALRAGRTAPERREVDPAAIRDVLAYTFILDVSQSAATGRRTVSFRLSGTRVNALFQRDLRGRDFRSIWAADHAGDVGAMLEVALDDRDAAVASVQGGPAGYRAIDLELLLLPLRHDGRTHARLLGSLAASASPGWMGLRPVEPLALTSFCAMTGLPHGASSPLGEPSREPPPPLERSPAGSRPGGALRVGQFIVYDGGRDLASRSGSEL